MRSVYTVKSENGAFSDLTVYILCRGGGLAERGSCAAGEQDRLEHC